MAVNYRLMKNNNASSANYGRYYAKAVHTETVDLDVLAERIQRNSTAKKSDCLAVLTELVEVLKDELMASHVVKINGLGSFKIGLKGKYAKTDSEFSASQHITGCKVNFRPEYTIINNGTYVDDDGNTKVKKVAISDLTKDLKLKMY
ncbi:MAG: HU family DNA-binding protein [Prevotellaceae bacterium]|nr:HU family DNA-binding protein [Prevotellaceae bacterium]